MPCKDSSPHQLCEKRLASLTNLDQDRHGTERCGLRMMTGLTGGMAPNDEHVQPDS